MSRILFIGFLALLLLNGYSATSTYPQKSYGTTYQLAHTQQLTFPHSIHQHGYFRGQIFNKEFIFSEEIEEEDQKFSRLLARQYKLLTNLCLQFLPVFDPANSFTRVIAGITPVGNSPGIYIKQHALRI